MKGYTLIAERTVALVEERTVSFRGLDEAGRQALWEAVEDEGYTIDTISNNTMILHKHIDRDVRKVDKL